MRRIPAQGCDILPLPRLIADKQTAGAECRPGGSAALARVIDPRQQAVGQVAGELAADGAAAAHADALMLGAEFRLIVYIAKAQGAGVKTVFACVGGTGDGRPVQLGMFPYPDIRPALAGKEAGLFLHRAVIAAYLVPADIAARLKLSALQAEIAPH